MTRPPARVPPPSDACAAAGQAGLVGLGQITARLSLLPGLQPAGARAAEVGLRAVIAGPPADVLGAAQNGTMVVPMIMCGDAPGADVGA